MNEGLEVIGESHGATLRDRRPESAPLGVTRPANVHRDRESYMFLASLANALGR